MELCEQSKLELNLCKPGILAGGLDKMFRNQLHTDITFVVSGGDRVSAHKIVLASQSEYFDCLLYGPMKEGQSSEVKLKDTPAEAFRIMLQLMYHGSISTLNLNTALDLHILADRFGITFIKDGLDEDLKKIISNDNVVFLHNHSQLVSSDGLQNSCEVFMDSHAQEVVKSKSLKYLTKEMLKSLLSRDTFVVKEVQIFEAVQRWLEGNSVERGTSRDLLDCVRLTEMDERDLEEKVLASGVFPQAKVLEVMEDISRQPVDSLGTRGRNSGETNLFKEGGAKLMTTSNYTVDVLSEKGGWMDPCNLIFSLTIPATDDPAHLTLKFDSLYVVNQLTFQGYMPDSDSRSGSPEYADMHSNPFCYKLFVSRDGEDWFMIVDYSKLRCLSTQKLFFPKMAIRYMRLLQTKGRDGFKIVLLSCSYVGPVPYNFRNCGIIAPFLPMTPEYLEFFRYSDNRSQTRLTLTLTQPYCITTFRLELEGLEGKADIAVRVASKNTRKAYINVFKQDRFNLRTTVVAEFDERPVCIVSVDLNLLHIPDQHPPLLNNPFPQFRVKHFVCQTIQ